MKRTRPAPPDYAELHCLSAFSFLRGASEPEELMRRAYDHNYTALAITDECSLAGVVRAFAERRRLAQYPSSTIFPCLLIGSEFLVRDDRGEPLFKLVLLATSLNGYGNLCQFITRLRRASPTKGDYRLAWSQIDPAALDDCLFILLPPRSASDAELLAPARWLLRHFPGRSWIGLTLLKDSGDARWLQRLQQLADITALPLVACGDVHMHVRSRKALQDVMTATRLGKTVAECGLDLQPNAERHLRSRFRLAQLYPHDALAQTIAIARRCEFWLDEIRYQYPSEVVPAGETPIGHLRRLTAEGAAKRWPKTVPKQWQARIEHELSLIEELRYEHYFLTVADIVRHARAIGILCQGRGSAANSVVCYCLHITSVNPEQSTLLFERFISRERNEPPDIDVDFEHERREEVIQYLYTKYGRERAALTAVVICYRPRSAIRDVGKALGFDEALIDVMATDHRGWVMEALPDDRLAALQKELNLDLNDVRLRQLVALSQQLNGMPRHLSQHVGGFVLTEGPLSRLVPIENAAMPNRSVVQWDKDDLESVGLMKVDVLALGMLSCLRRAFDLYREQRGIQLELATVQQDDVPTYDMICAADTVGVFQIESRAQMSMLPRLQPRKYYDLVIEVAIVRPGPIEGGMVHPYLTNREKERRGEEIKYPKDELKAALSRTCGVPIFQEQVMQVAMIAASFTPGEADQLRRAMASWKKPGVLNAYYEKIITGMRRNGYEDAFAQRIFRQIQGFSSYGFPESHAASFALLTYVSCWMKKHEPAIFLCALLNSQPLGFYTPSQLVQDAQRHDIEVRPADAGLSDKDSTLEPCEGSPQPAVRLGLRLISGLSDAAADRIVAARAQAPFANPQDLALRAGLDQREMQQLAAGDALMSLAGHRRQQVWQASALRTLPRLLHGSIAAEDELELPEAAEDEEVLWDYASLGLTLRSHPLAILRERLAQRRLQSAAQLKTWESDRVAHACGIVTGRQMPQTAKGTVFITLEDETGHVQVIVWPSVYAEHRTVILRSRLLAVHGRWQRGDGGVQHVVAHRFENLTPLLGRLAMESRDFK